MRFIHFICLCLGLAANAAVIKSPINNTTEIEALDAATSSTGYRSVAYFVNWVCNDSDI
jgi:hypothetical protein